MSDHHDRPLVYLAAPYSNPDPVQNTHRAIRLADIAMRRMAVTVHVPHLSLMWHLVAPKPYEHWLSYDLTVLARCDLLWRAPGESSGANAEVAFARSHGIDVVHSMHEMRDWLDGADPLGARAREIADERLQQDLDDFDRSNSCTDAEDFGDD